MFIWSQSSGERENALRMHVLSLKPPVTVYNACNTAIMLKELESLRFRYAPRNRYVKDVCLTKLVKINI